jgi:hypothetical protein
MDTDMSDRHNGLLRPRAVPEAPPGYSYVPTASGYEIQQAQPGIDRVMGNWAKDQPIDAVALATTPIPIVGDVAGFANDLRHYWNEPEERKWQNYTFTAAGLLPFVPPAMPFTRAVGRAANGKENTEHAREGATYEQGTAERDMLAQLLRGNS